MRLSHTLRFILNHPINRGHPVAALVRFVKWQVLSRLQDQVIFDWIDGAKLIVKSGMTGATGNIYCGLHEYSDMAFVMHLLREEDLFLDLGANIGSYTVLASGVCGARSISVEPDPGTLVSLQRNVKANGIGDRVEIVQTALGASPGVAQFSIGLDTMNRILTEGTETGRKVRMTPLDAIVGDRSPTMIKMDVEGYEAEVLKGASRTLEKDTLLAIETETSSREVVAALTEAGFERWFYNPANRELSKVSLGAFPSNALYLRDIECVRQRVAEAQSRQVLGKLI